MLSTTQFLQFSLWAGILTLVFAAVTVLAFIFKWGIRFRLVGATGFMGVLAAGLFALGLVPITRTVIPGAVRFSRIYDNGSTQVVIGVPTDISESQLEATLRQAASDLYSYGRLGKSENDQLTVRVRTVIHPQSGISKPLYLGQIKRSLTNREDPNMEIQLFPENITQLPEPAAS